MANHQTIMRLRPSYAEFAMRGKLRHRGETLFFPANYRGEHFSTDGRGFRHTSFNGETLSVADIRRRGRYGIVLGTSRAFGIGVAGNQNTMPSLLSQHFGFPFANVALPQGNSRNLFSLLYAFMVRGKAPAVVLHSTTGDLTGFTYTSVVDPIFGSPNPKLLKLVEDERRGSPPTDGAFDHLLAFSQLWTRALANLCKNAKVPLVLFHDSSFFEKRQPSPYDVECELGTPYLKFEKRWFDGHKMFADRFLARREGVADQLGLPLAGPGRANDLSFVDEFHYDEAGTRAITRYVTDAMAPLLNR